MKIEIIRAPNCARCAPDDDGLRAAALAAHPDLEWRVVNVLQELDYAVELGVLSLPAVAIDGELAFASLPTPEQLKAAIMRRKAAAR